MVDTKLSPLCMLKDRIATLKELEIKYAKLGNQQYTLTKVKEQLKINESLLHDMEVHLGSLKNKTT